jgi:hypothetical protein
MKKTFFETFIENQNKFTTTLKKSSNKIKFKKCSRKCQRVLQRKTFKIKPQDIKQVLYNTCVKNYCNPKCKGFYAFKINAKSAIFIKIFIVGSQRIFQKNREQLLLKRGHYQIVSVIILYNTHVFSCFIG